MAADGDLDETVRRVDPGRWLASRFIGDALQRADVIAIYAFDHELDRAGRVTSNALLAEIRLTWWREVLDEVFSGVAVREHPISQALKEVVRRRRLPRGPLESMIDGRIDGTGDPVPWADATAGAVAVLAGLILDPHADSTPFLKGGRVWGLSILGGQGRGAMDIAAAFADAAREARRVNVAAFPAIAYATLARAGQISAVEARARLLWSVLRGRL